MCSCWRHVRKAAEGEIFKSLSTTYFAIQNCCDADLWEFVGTSRRYVRKAVGRESKWSGYPLQLWSFPLESSKRPARCRRYISVHMCVCIYVHTYKCTHANLLDTPYNYGCFPWKVQKDLPAAEGKSFYVWMFLYMYIYIYTHIHMISIPSIIMVVSSRKFTQTFPLQRVVSVRMYVFISV